MPRPWHITAGETDARRLPGGKCSRNFANGTSRSREGIGFTLFGGFYKLSMAYRALPDCLRTVFFSYGIECPEVPRR